MKAIGFIGGTFDPIHYGHLKPAMEINQALQLQRLFFMPNHIAPHKSKSHCTAQQRAEMVKLAIQSLPNTQLDRRELNRHQASYTIDTLKEIRSEYPNTPICFIMGMDSMQTFNSWYQWQDILNYCHLVISQRPGYQTTFNETVNNLLAQRKITRPAALNNVLAGHIFFQPTSELDISSTKIRQYIEQEKSIKALLPSCVADYIRDNNLYQAQEIPCQAGLSHT